MTILVDALRDSATVNDTAVYDPLALTRDERYLAGLIRASRILDRVVVRENDRVAEDLMFARI